MTDTLQPNVLTIDANGDIGADFSGSVTLPAGTTGAPASQSAVKWTRTSDGALVGEVYGAEVAGEDFVSIRALATAAGNSSQAFLRATDGAGNADLSISKKPGSAVANGSFGALVTTDAGIRTIFDDIGESSFLQLLSAQKLQLAGQFDTGVLGPIAQNGNVASASIAHGLGRAPKAVIGNLYDGNWSSLCSWRASWDATNVVITIGNPGGQPATTAGLKFYVLG